MKTFKQFLNENVGESEPRKDMERWFYDHIEGFRPGKLYVEDDGIVYETHMEFNQSLKEKTLPYKMKEVHGDFIFKGYDKLTSFENFPRVIKGDFMLNNTQIKTLDNCPEEVGGYFCFRRGKLKSLKDIHKKIKKMKGQLLIDGHPIKGPMLGIILIEGCDSVYWNSTKNGGFAPRPSEYRIQRAFEIIDKYCGKGKAGVLQAQEALEEDEMNLEEFAGL